MVEFLSRLFGERIVFSEYSLPKSAPFYLIDGYRTVKMSLNNIECILLTPIDMDTRLPVLKKHCIRICEICSLPCALNLEKLTVGQRENLISDNIPFVSGMQVYLPFWGAAFTEKLLLPREIPKTMTPTTQLVFLYVFFSLSAEMPVNASIVSKNLELPKSTAAKAVQDLSEYGLFSMTQDGTNKWISLNGESSDVLQRAVCMMRSPVRKEIWLKEIPEDIPYMLGGIRGLSEDSMLMSDERDGAIVYGRDDAKRIPKEMLVSRRDFDDFGGFAAEIWSYDPGMLSGGRVVDDISLFICLKDIEDERVQKELDTIREKYGIEECEN